MDFYKTLGIPYNAPNDEINKAYRKMVMECHPDRNPGDADAVKRFLAVQGAYEALTNPHYRPPRGPSAPGPRPRPHHSTNWIKDAPQSTHDIWGESSAPEPRQPRPRSRPPGSRVIVKHEPEVDLWKSVETKASRFSGGYWQEYNRLKKAMAYDEPDKFWEAITEWVHKNQ